tara:strand:+ start:400 stop:657 length:258 start_codon:yes stop_codon:yes gene_type:complete
MISFAKTTFGWFNTIVKNGSSNITDRIVSRYLDKENDTSVKQKKSTDINILLNRIQVNKKNESKKKLYFSAAASTGLILFGLIIF